MNNNINDENAEAFVEDINNKLTINNLDAISIKTYMDNREPVYTDAYYIIENQIKIPTSSQVTGDQI